MPGLNGESSFLSNFLPFLQGVGDLSLGLGATLGRSPEGREAALRMLALNQDARTRQDEIRQRRIQTQLEEMGGMFDMYAKLAQDPRAFALLNDPNSGVGRGLASLASDYDALVAQSGMDAGGIGQARAQAILGGSQTLPPIAPDATQGVMQNRQEDASLASAAMIASELMQAQSILDEAPGDKITQARVDALRSDLLNASTREEVIIPLIVKRLTNQPLMPDEDTILAVLDQLGFWQELAAELAGGGSAARPGALNTGLASPSDPGVRPSEADQLLDTPTAISIWEEYERLGFDPMEAAGDMTSVIEAARRSGRDPVGALQDMLIRVRRKVRQK